MQTHSHAELRNLRADRTFRTAPWATLVLPALLAAGSVALAAAFWATSKIASVGPGP